ncbi:MAG: hypothetical protein H9W81_15770 [Enterococcus sp.]|nr:hypothetical protein [Enterococcus sp.]
MIDKKFLLFAGFEVLAIALTILFVEDTTLRIVIIMLIASVGLLNHLRLTKKNKGNADQSNP